MHCLKMYQECLEDDIKEGCDDALLSRYIVYHNTWWGIKHFDNNYNKDLLYLAQNKEKNNFMKF